MKLPPLSATLLPWYEKNKRPLPWRDSRDPYRIWVSEIMLQQTQVKTVIPYYHRWLDAFPDIASLAKAPLSKVLKLWEGLGYYRRANNLHETAKVIVENHNGRFPSDPAMVYSLPGIGKYTGGAILSIAFGKSAPILDGNVARILSRIFALDDPVDTPKGLKKLWKLAALLLPEKNPGDFNQSMMELGATLCLPQEPACLICPVSELCKAHETGKEQDCPRKSGKTKIKKVRAACAVVSRDGRVLITQRPASGLWAHLWEFPTFRIAEKEDAGSFLTKQLLTAGLNAQKITLKTSLRRAYTDHVENLEIYGCELSPERSKTLSVPDAPFSGQWVKPRELKRFAFSSAHAKIIREYL